MSYKVKLIDSVQLTHDVKRFIIEKPSSFTYTPGQAIDMSINTPDLKDETRPFTFTSLESAEDLEFTIKRYDDHQGITKRIHALDNGSELLITKPFGAIHYDGEGVFIAGGAGVTPFIAILRMLRSRGLLGNNKLIFSNKTSSDVILEDEWKDVFKKSPQNLILTLTREKRENYENGRIDSNFLSKHINDYSKHFYVCGPKPFVKEIRGHLESLGASPEFLIFEK
ncbi:MAG TPA: FAD-binding oxidoreductase [Patescibacteria group bacterium]|nr:FAD-binding oxidoreductase [Patescibacteria group bacterium]